MMKNVRLILYALTMTLSLAACSGDDGDPGPKGDTGAQGEQGEKGTQGEPGEDAASKQGHFQGTVKGTRRDGTPFEESFAFEYVYGNEVFPSEEVVLKRFETASGAIADAIATAAEQAGNPIDVPSDKGFFKLFAYRNGNSIEPYDMDFYFTKGLNATQLFQLKASPHFADASYNRLIELTPEQAGIYDFEHSNSGQVSYYEVDLNNDGKMDANELWTELTMGYINYTYDMKTGNLLGVNLNGEYMTEGTVFEKYDDIRFVFDEALERYVFVKTSDGTPLYEFVEDVPADAFTITNYKNEEGVISFDFTLTISKYRGYMGTRSPMGPIFIDGENTTRHDLTITGKFTSGGKIYKETVGRVKIG